MSKRAEKVGQPRALVAQKLLVPEPCTRTACGALGVVEVAPHARALRGRVVLCAMHARETGIGMMADTSERKRVSARRGQR